MTDTATRVRAIIADVLCVDPALTMTADTSLADDLGAVMCDPCFERRCEARLEAALESAPTPPTDDGDPDEWAAIIPY